MRSLVTALLVRPALFVTWALAFWGAAVWLLLFRHAFLHGPGAAAQAFGDLAAGSKLSMALAVAGVVIAVRAVQLQRRWALQHVSGAARG